MTIVNGQTLETAETSPVKNPATGDVFAEAPCCDLETLDRAVAAAGGAFSDWARRDDRSELLLECARQLKGQTVKLARLLTQEQGKPLRESMNEIMGATAALRHAAGMETPPCRERVDDGSGPAIEIRRRPLGVVAAIAPWNFPVILAIWKIAPSLRAGNTIVLKPSPYTPLTTLAIGDLFRDILPPGVLNIVAGGDEIGAALVRHPLVRKITLTGSVETGKAVAHSAANDLKSVVLELGGNDAAIVLPDADPGGIAKDLFWGAFRNCGQVCLAIKRLYVHEAIFTEVVEELKQIAEGLVIGDGLDPKTQLGPVNNRAQLDRVDSLVQGAVGAGAEVVTGGARRPGAGFFFDPTIVTGIAEGVPLVDEEQFGPVLPVMSFTDVEEAIRRANQTPFGLGGSVWSADRDRAAEFAARLECGTVWVNRHGHTDLNAPIGGRKLSGIGYENGAAGYAECLQLQTVYAGP